jgi:hypothetical protein
MMALGVDGENHFVEMPFVTRPGTVVPELISTRLTKLPAPLPDGFVGYDHATDEQLLFTITVAEAEAEVWSDAMAEDLSWEAMVLATPSRWCAHGASIAHQASIGEATQQVNEIDPPLSNVAFRSQNGCGVLGKPLTRRRRVRWHSR